MLTALPSASHYGLSKHHLKLHYHRVLLRKYTDTHHMFSLCLSVISRKEQLIRSLITDLVPLIMNEVGGTGKCGTTDPADHHDEDLRQQIIRNIELSVRNKSLNNLSRYDSIYSKEASDIMLRVFDGQLAAECRMSTSKARESRRKEEALRNFFGLNDIDLDIFRFCLVFIEDCEPGQSLAAAVFGESRDEFIKGAALCTGLRHTAIKNAISNKGNLARKFILVKEYAVSRILLWGINETILEFISGMAEADNLMDMYIRRDNRRAIPIESFDISRQHSATMLKLLSIPGPVNILLHGAAGTGKTEYARSLVNAAGKHAVFAVTRLYEEGHNVRPSVLEPALNLIGENDILIIDEADHLISSNPAWGAPNIDKGWINDFLDGSAVKIIWITNEARNIPESHLRRFSYSLAFKPFSEHSRRTIWHSQLTSSSLRSIITPPVVEALANEYQVSAGGIASACASAQRLYASGTCNAEEIIRTVCDILKQHQELISGTMQSRQSLFSLTGAFNPDFINTSQPISTVLEPLAVIAGHIRNGVSGEHHANLLFYGIPGTGKTELVKYIGTCLRMKVIFKRASDLLSPYVGMTERLLNESFREAENERKILFIDEADTFFRERMSISRSWEISQINELLTQMENFRGIFICCTNMKTLIDQAALRRFNWKIEFLPLRGEQVADVFTAYFPGQASKGCTIKIKETGSTITVDFDGDVIIKNGQLQKK